MNTLYTPSPTPSIDPIDPIIDIIHHRYPYCLVWSPLPCLTWLLPCVGHLGIADSKGIIHDFAGPYFIGHDNFAFGAPTRYLIFNPKHCHDKDWDIAIEEGCDEYLHHMHNLCWDNCHSHVAWCLNVMGYGHYRWYGMVHLALWVFVCGRFTSISSMIYTLGPTICIVLLVILWQVGVI